MRKLIHSQENWESAPHEVEALASKLRDSRLHRIAHIATESCDETLTYGVHGCPEMGHQRYLNMSTRSSPLLAEQCDVRNVSLASPRRGSAT